MARKVINIGTAAGAGNGDPARVAFDKCNENFEELYSIVNEDQGIEVPLNLTSETATEKLRLNGPSSSISGNSIDGATNYGLLVFTPTQTQVRGASIGLFTNGIQRVSVDSSGSATFTGPVTAPSFVGNLTGSASSATTATNLIGGSVAATTGSFSGPVSTNGSSIDTSSLSFSAYQSPFNLNFGGGAQNLNIGVRTLSQTVNVGSASEESSIYRFGTGPTKAGALKSVSLGTGGVAGSDTRVFIGSGAGGFMQVDCPQVFMNIAQAASFVGPLTGNASTATALQTSRSINGVPFNGTADVSVDLSNSITAGSFLTGGSFNGSAPATFSVDATSANTASKVVSRDGSGNFSAGTITASLNGNASTATTAVNLNGGTVNATTGAFSGDVQLNGATVTTTAATFNLLENGISNLRFGGGTQDLDIGVRIASQTINIGSASNTSSIYRFGTGPTQSGASKSVSLGTGGVSGSTTSVFIGSGAGGTCQIDSPTTSVSLLTLSQARFPATQVPSGDPNTLDDYEEGTWIPTVAGSTTAGSASYTTRVGTYTKVGRVVTLHCAFDWTGGTGSGRLRITNLPFAASLNTAYMGSSRIIGGPTWAAGATPTPGINPGFTIVEFDTHSSGALTPGSVAYTPAGGVIFSITYEV